jgi:hypothetical protein
MRSVMRRPRPTSQDDLGAGRLRPLGHRVGDRVLGQDAGDEQPAAVDMAAAYAPTAATPDDRGQVRT